MDAAHEISSAERARVGAVHQDVPLVLVIAADPQRGLPTRGLLQIVGLPFLQACQRELARAVLTGQKLVGDLVMAPRADSHYTSRNRNGPREAGRSWVCTGRFTQPGPSV